MADRSRRMVRPQISDDPSDDSLDSSPDQASESEEEELEEGDYDPRSTDAMRRSGRQDAASSATISQPSVSPRSRARISGRSSAAITKSHDDRRQSLKLTVKAPPSKLREVMRANEVDSLHDVLGGGQVIEGRRRRAQAPPRVSGRAAERPRYTEYAESDLEEDDEEEVDEDMEDAAGEDDDDVEMEDAPVPPKAPKITLKPPAKASRQTNPRITVETPNVGRVKSVEEQEMQDNPGDEEVDSTSDLSDDDDNDDDDEEEEDEEDEEEEEEVNEEVEETNLDDEDAPGEEDEVEVDQNNDGEIEQAEEDEDDGSLDSDDDSELAGSGAATPDPANMTKRQRRTLEGDGLMALEMGPQQRKFFTDEEKAMKKDEHARKRKELTKRKIQEEKNAALNRLLKPQASKARGAAPKPETLLALERAGEISVAEEDEHERANPLYTRWISTRGGETLSIPEEWLGKRAGRMFGPPLQANNGTLVQELS